MAFSKKETGLLQDLKAQEKLCVEKYNKYAQQACDTNLQRLFAGIGKTEQEHYDTVTGMLQGEVPPVPAGKKPQRPKTQEELKSAARGADKTQDAFLCADSLGTEKFVSGAYNTSVFEFKDPQVRGVLAHIQQEEQNHGEQIYNYMAANGMYE